MIKKDTSLSDDLLVGAEQIGAFLGPSFNARAIYYMWENGELKTAFKKNGKICDRKSELRREFSAESAV